MDGRPLDAALARLAGHGCDLVNGLTNHAPMVAEALETLDVPDAIEPWVAAELERIEPRPPPGQPIEPGSWRTQLGVPERFADWSEHFVLETAAHGWRSVLARWAERLAPGFATAAAHGVIRVGHAARGVRRKDNDLRRRELADALAAWASQYAALPEADGAALELSPAAALERVALVKDGDHAPAGSISAAVARLGSYPDFAPVLHWLGANPDPQNVASAFARLFLQSADSTLRAIVFTHALTGLAAALNIGAALRSGADTRRLTNELVRRAWHTGCALHAVYSDKPYAYRTSTERPPSRQALVGRALQHGDEHVIKLTEACLNLHRASADPHLLLAAARAAELIPPRRAA